MSTIKEVAERANVSPTTVSHIINKTRFVSEDVKQRVLTAMQELDYQPNALARSLRSGKTHTLGLVLPDSGNPYFAQIGRGIEAAAYQLGYSVILCNTEGMPEKESFYLNVLYNKRVDGIVLVSVGASTVTARFLQERNIPVVAVDREFEEAALDIVLSDNLQGGLIATRHLIVLGHRRIGCITGPSDISPSAARATGYRQALQAAGLPLDEALICVGDFHSESGWKAALNLLQLPDRPTAIFACNDLMALGVLRAAAERSLRVPGDLALVGYDDIDLAAYTTPPLTTVAQSTGDISKLAVERLVKRINRREDAFSRDLLQPVLKIRQSCGATA